MPVVGFMFGDFTSRKMVLAELPGAIESQKYDGVRHQKLSFLGLRSPNHTF